MKKLGTPVDEVHPTWPVIFLQAPSHHRITDMTLRLAVLLSGGGRTLVNLQESIQQGILDAEIPLVISSIQKAGGVQRAKDLGLQVEVLRPRDFKTHQDFADAQANRLRECQPDLVVMAGYLVFFPVPADMTWHILNIHPSLLPRHGGKGMYGHHVHNAVLAAGDTESGCTVHVVDNEYDHGPIVIQSHVPVLAQDTADTLAARVFKAECATYPEAIRRYAGAGYSLPLTEEG